MKNPKIVECLFGKHDFSLPFPKYKNTVLCAHCKRKTKTTNTKTRYRYKSIMYGDVVAGRIVHIKYMEIGGINYRGERWLSNGAKVYDKRRGGWRTKRQIWRRRKPKNWIYEGKITWT